ncbi:MAG: hypothetical protein AAF436_11665 [Myxococcota bacterium]
MDKVLDDSDWSAKAWMSKPDANLFDALVHIKSADTQGRLDVLEWGAGRSTKYFTTALAALRGHNFCWHSIEYDRGYFEAEIGPNLDDLPPSTVAFVEPGHDPAALFPGTSPVEFAVYNHGTLRPMLDEGVEDRKVDMDAYVAHPSRLGRRFDLILVDGRKRRRCLIEASALLKPNGVAVLHDAQRTYYHCAFDSYRTNSLLGEILWFGTQEGAAFFADLCARAEAVAPAIGLGIPLSPSVALPQ